MKITLLKEWQNGDQLYKPQKYQVLEVPDDVAKQLIEDGIANKHDAEVQNIAIERDVEAIEKDIQAQVDAKFKELEGKQQKQAKINIDEDKLEKTGGYDEMWQFAQDIYKAGRDGRGASEKLRTWDNNVKTATTKTAGHMAEGDQVQGGYLVPTEFRAELLRHLLEAGFVRSRARVMPMQTNHIKIPRVRDASHASSVYGGIVLYHTAEAAQKDVSKPALGECELTLHKLTGLIYVSDELIEDSPITIEPLITSMFGEAFAWQEDEDFINGTGAAMPLGVLTAPCLVAQAKETGQAATTIVTENIVKMWSRMRPRGQANAVWMANIDTFPQLATLELAVGTGGSGVGLLNVNATGAAGAPLMTLMGRPLILTEHCQTVGAQGDILLADWRQYLIGQKAGTSALQTASSIHLRFDYDETAFRFVMRYDGQPWESTSLTPVHSAITLGSFVTLAARA